MSDQTTDTSATGAWRRLRRLLGGSDIALDKVLRTGATGSLIHFQALDAMAMADRGSPIRQSDLQVELNLSQSGVSRLISRLHGAGFIERATSNDDARTALIGLTEVGQRAWRADRSEFERYFRDELRAVSRAIADDAPVLPDPAPAGPLTETLPFGESELTISGSAVRAAEAVVLREALEPLVLLDAAAYRSKGDIRDCRDIVQEMRSAIGDPAEFFRCDWRLHRRLLELSRNRLLVAVYDSLLTTVEQSFTGVLSTDGLPEYLDRRAQIHATIVDAVASGNSDLVTFAAREHAYTSRSAEFLASHP